MPYIRSPYDAELNAMEQMRKMGYLDAEVSAVGPDGGIDVRSSSAIAQVKWRGGQTSRGEIQNLFGARANNRHLDMLFFSAAGYSKNAVEYANDVSVLLFTYEPDGKILPINQVAHERISRSIQTTKKLPSPQTKRRRLTSDEEAAQLRTLREQLANPAEPQMKYLMEQREREAKFYDDVPPVYRRPDVPRVSGWP